MSLGVPNRLGLENLTVIDLSPPEMIVLAAKLGCGWVSLYTRQGPQGRIGFGYVLEEDSALRRETAARARDLGVGIALLDGFIVAPGLEASAHEASFALAAELGIRRVNTVSIDPDWSRTVDQVCELAVMARAHNLDLLIEPCPWLTVQWLGDAMRLIADVGTDRLRILVDTMHFGRWGTTAAEIAALDPMLFGYVQLCDGPLGIATAESYRHDAVFGRIVPGEGALPLADYLAVLPRDLVVSVEMPMHGVAAFDRARASVTGARRLLDATGEIAP